MMANVMKYQLWLEFEEYESKDEDYFNMKIILDDEREYALTVWTKGFLQSEMKSHQYIVAPDLVVESATRQHIESVVKTLIENEELDDSWQV